MCKCITRVSLYMNYVRRKKQRDKKQVGCYVSRREREVEGGCEQCLPSMNVGLFHMWCCNKVLQHGVFRYSKSCGPITISQMIFGERAFDSYKQTKWKNMMLRSRANKLSCMAKQEHEGNMAWLLLMQTEVSLDLYFPSF